MAKRCAFMRDWAGQCDLVPVGRSRYCEKHRGYTCGINGCTRQATHSCSMTMQFVCGMPLCNAHETALHSGHRERELA